MSILDRAIERLRREMFLPSLLGMVINPFHIARRALYKNVRQLAPMLEGNILDFGCGSKPYESLFTSSASYCGVDIRVSGHDHRQSKVDYFYDGTTLPFEDSRFDGVVSFETLEHIFNLPRILFEINRISKLGGSLLVSVPFVWDEHEAPYDCARYTSYGLTHVLRQAGFEVMEFRKSTSYLLTIAQMFIAYLSQYCFPRRGFFRHACQGLFIFPISVISYALDFLLPKRYELFCDCVVMARKIGPAKPVLL